MLKEAFKDVSPGFDHDSVAQCAIPFNKTRLTVHLLLPSCPVEFFLFFLRRVPLSSQPTKKRMPLFSHWASEPLSKGFKPCLRHVESSRAADLQLDSISYGATMSSFSPAMWQEALGPRWVWLGGKQPMAAWRFGDTRKTGGASVRG